MLPPEVKNIPWTELQHYSRQIRGSSIRESGSGGRVWYLGEGKAGEWITVHSNPRGSAPNMDSSFTFRADLVREAFKKAGIKPTPEFVKKWFTTDWKRAERPFGDPHGDPAEDPDERPPDFQAPDPPREGENGPGEK
jgi:hypothetical protein